MRAWRHPNGWWYAVHDDGKRYSLRTKDREEAFRALADAKQRKPQGHTVAEIMTAYLADKSDRASHERMDFAWQRLKPHFGHLKPDHVTREVCRAYIAKRSRAGRGAGTIRKELTTLRSALRWQQPQTPAIIVMPNSPPPRDRHLTKKEFQKILEKADAFHVKLFIVLALTTAGRKEAILSLTWDQVDFKRGLINLGRGPRQKGRATVPMNDLSREWLLKAQEAATSDYVIEWGGGRVQSIRKGFDRACARAKAKDVTPHTLRHTAAVWMAEAGVSMPEIASYLGHTDSRTTERVYAKFSPSYLKKAAGALQ